MKSNSNLVWKPGLILVITLVVLAVVYFRPGEASSSLPAKVEAEELILIKTNLLVSGFLTLTD